MTPLVPIESVQQRIYLIRGHKVILDVDLARLYGVQTFNLNKAVKRNMERFPRDFMFSLTHEEWKNLIFQSGRSSGSSPAGSSRWGGRRHVPHAFTEQGVAMLSSVLRTPRAVQVNIAITRAFVRLRHIISLHRDLARRIAAQEKKTEGLTDYVQKMFDLIQPLIDGPVRSVRRIGFEKGL
jgi:hypothetical protein